jgi:hypothetical protein
MIGVPKDGNVGMKPLEGVLCMLSQTMGYGKHWLA